VSRAYYAAFILARNHLRDVDQIPIPRTGNVHVFVASTYRNHTDPRRNRIGSLLRRLKDDRNRCDYDDAVTNLATLPLVSLQTAARILADLARL
jgi:hypothetical protein